MILNIGIIFIIVLFLFIYYFQNKQEFRNTDTILNNGIEGFSNTVFSSVKEYNKAIEKTQQDIRDLESNKPIKEAIINKGFAKEQSELKTAENKLKETQDKYDKNKSSVNELPKAKKIREIKKTQLINDYKSYGCGTVDKKCQTLLDDLRKTLKVNNDAKLKIQTLTLTDEQKNLFLSDECHLPNPPGSTAFNCNSHWRAVGGTRWRSMCPGDWGCCRRYGGTVKWKNETDWTQALDRKNKCNPEKQKLIGETCNTGTIEFTCNSHWDRQWRKNCPGDWGCCRHYGGVKKNNNENWQQARQRRATCEDNNKAKKDSLTQIVDTNIKNLTSKIDNITKAESDIDKISSWLNGYDTLLETRKSTHTLLEEQLKYEKKEVENKKEKLRILKEDIQNAKLYITKYPIQLAQYNKLLTNLNVSKREFIDRLDLKKYTKNTEIEKNYIAKSKVQTDYTPNEEKYQLSSDGKYYLTQPNELNCPHGYETVPKNNCNRVATTFIPEGTEHPKRSLQVGAWSWVPAGCSIQSGGDWAAHYGTGKGATKEALDKKSKYRKICQKVPIKDTKVPYNIPGCYIQLPSGCPRHPKQPQITNPLGGWVRDFWGERNRQSHKSQTKCDARITDYNNWCGVNDTQALHIPVSNKFQKGYRNLLYLNRLERARARAIARARSRSSSRRPRSYRRWWKRR